MLYEILQYAQRTGITTEPGFTVKTAKWAITIDSLSRINGIIPLGDPKIGKTFSRCPDLSLGEMIAGGITRSHFLIDSISVVALFYKADSDNKDIERYHAKHQYFIQQLEQAGNDCPDLLLAAKALKDTEQLQKLQQFIESQQPKPKFTDSITLLINDDFPLESDNWHDWWRNYRQQINPPKEGEKSAALMCCLLTGEMIEPVKTHPKIKGLSSVGGLGAGDVFIGFDKESFRSFGLEQSLNAAMSEVTAKNYVETLKHLISEQSSRLVNSLAIHWFGRTIQKDDDPLAFLENPDEPPAGQETRPKQLLNAIKEGQRPDLLNNYYYCLIISGQAGRVMVRDFQQGQLEHLLENISAWFEDLKIIHRDGTKSARPPKFLAVVGCLFRDLKDAPAPLINELWRAALNHEIPIPYNAFTNALLETRKAIINEEAPNHARMGLLKAFLIRKGKYVMSEKLNPNHPEPAYHCGRLLSVLADLQYEALGDVGSGVIQRYYTATSQTPALRIGQLMANAKNHLNKTDKAGIYERRIAEIMDSMATIPRTLDLEHQSLFALGYYHQMAQKHTDIDAYKATDAYKAKKSTQKSNQAEEN